MASIAEDIEVGEIAVVLILVIFIVYEIAQAGSSLGDIFTNLWQRLKDAFSGGGNGSLFGGSDSGNSTNPNSLPPTTTDNTGTGTCNAMICTGVGG